MRAAQQWPLSARRSFASSSASEITLVVPCGRGEADGVRNNGWTRVEGGSDWHRMSGPEPEPEPGQMSPPSPTSPVPRRSGDERRPAPTASDGPNTRRGRGRAGCWQRGQRIRTRILRGRYNGYSEHLGAEQLRAWKEEEESRSDGSAKQIVWRREEEEEQGEHLLFQRSSGVLPSTKLYDRNLSSLGICGNFLRTSENQKTSLIITKINFVLLLFSVDVGAILILGFLIFSILWIRELSLVTINILQDKLGFLCYIFILRF